MNLRAKSDSARVTTNELCERCQAKLPPPSVTKALKLCLSCRVLCAAHVIERVYECMLGILGVREGVLRISRKG